MAADGPISVIPGIRPITIKEFHAVATNTYPYPHLARCLRQNYPPVNDEDRFNPPKSPAASILYDGIIALFRISKKMASDSTETIPLMMEHRYFRLW